MERTEIYINVISSPKSSIANSNSLIIVAYLFENNGLERNIFDSIPISLVVARFFFFLRRLLLFSFVLETIALFWQAELHRDSVLKININL